MVGRSSLEGSLGFISLADIFQILGGNASTGILELTTPYAPYPGLIHFEGGNPINASCGTLNGVEAVYALFGWIEGRFEFREEQVTSGRAIKQARMQIVLDALRMLDDGVIKQVGAPVSLHEAVAEGTEAASATKDMAPIIKGPFVDYSFIIGEEEFPEGDKVIKEGAHGKWIWVILEGSVEVNRETSNGPITVARMGEGCFVGTISALLFQEHARSANVKALSSLRLGLLDTERLSKIFTSLSPDFRSVLVSLDRRLRRITDRAVDLFAGEDGLAGAADGKEIVMEKGSPKEELFTILDGEALLIGESQKGSLPLVLLGKEDLFGFLPFLDTGLEPRSAAVAASKELKTRPLDSEALQKEYNQLPATFKNLIYHMGLCIFATTRTLYHIHQRD
ncbi:MAG: cyclic nucleotide-binding domain-containing protein [Deltaproteobacteria bacterium]|nr:cyclic nucleotide-binding domain-containing protein [Deltaproteobacteria bacterium]